MARRYKDDDDVVLPPPATTLEGREDQLIAAAFDLVETRIRGGTASAQETVHFLRLGSRQALLQNEKLVGENTVLKAKVKEMESRKSTEELYKRALDAMRGYAGHDTESDGFDDTDVY